MDLSTAEAIFELDGEYTAHDVRAAYKRLALKHHPDQNENSRASNYFMQRINAAYELLLKAANNKPAPKASKGTQNKPQDKNAGAYRNNNSESQGKRKSDESSEQERRNVERERRQAAERERRERERREAERRQKQAAERERKKREEQAKKTEDEYLSACELSLTASSLNEHRRAASIFKKLEGYKDSESYYANHKSIVDEREKKVRRVNAYSFPTIAIAAIVFMLLATVEAGPFVGIGVTLYCGGWLPIFCGFEATRPTNEDPRRLVGTVGIVFALGALMVSILFDPGCLFLLVVSVGQFVGGLSCIIKGTSKSGVTARIILSSIAYLAIVTAIGLCIHSLI